MIIIPEEKISKKQRKKANRKSRNITTLENTNSRSSSKLHNTIAELHERYKKTGSSSALGN
jgi:hypothetical protein